MKTETMAYLLEVGGSGNGCTTAYGTARGGADNKLLAIVMTTKST
jgi:hypothetical protein